MVSFQFLLAMTITMDGIVAGQTFQDASHSKNPCKETCNNVSHVMSISVKNAFNSISTVTS